MVTAEKDYDVFFSYCHEDAALVENIALSVEKKAKIKIWLDKWVLVPGQSFRQALEKGIDEARSYAVFVGAQTPKRWVKEELDKAIIKQNSDSSFRVIPVLLPDADAKNLNGFLSSRTWVDFKKGIKDANAINLLICGISGTPPGKPITAKKQPKAKPNADEEVDIVLTIQGDLESYTPEEKKALLDAIQALLKCRRTIKIKQMTKGSIKMTLGLKRSEAERLKKAIEKGELAQFNVIGAVITNTDTTGRSEGVDELKTASIEAGRSVDDEATEQELKTKSYKLTSKPGNSNQNALVRSDEQVPRRKRVIALREGDRKAWANLYREYRPMIMQMVKLNGGTVEDAVDLYQDALIILLKKMQEEQLLITDSSISTYIYAICRQLWINKVKELGDPQFEFKEVNNKIGLGEKHSFTELELVEERNFIAQVSRN